jgi:hypothetical protein
MMISSMRRQKFDWRHDPMRCPTSRILDEVRDLSVGKDRDAIEREARTSAIPDEPLSGFVLVGADVNRGVHVEVSRRSPRRGMTPWRSA